MILSTEEGFQEQYVQEPKTAVQSKWVQRKESQGDCKWWAAATQDSRQHRIPGHPAQQGFLPLHGTMLLP